MDCVQILHNSIKVKFNLIYKYFKICNIYLLSFLLFSIFFHVVYIKDFLLAELRVKYDNRYH